MFHLAPLYAFDVPLLLTVEPEAYDLLEPEVDVDDDDGADADRFEAWPVATYSDPFGWFAVPRNAAPATRRARRRRHPGVEFAVDGADGQHVFKTFDEAAAFAVGVAASNGRRTNLDVLVYSPAGAKWWRGDDGVADYKDDPEASVFERIVVRADSEGRVA
jgi:hypothetical protein